MEVFSPEGPTNCCGSVGGPIYQSRWVLTWGSPQGSRLCNCADAVGVPGLERLTDADVKLVPWFLRLRVHVYSVVEPKHKIGCAHAYSEAVGSPDVKGG